MYKKVLVPLEGSELAEVALPYAEELAGRLGSKVTLLCVSESAEAQDYYKHQIYLERIVETTKHGVMRYLENVEGAVKVELEISVGSLPRRL